MSNFKRMSVTEALAAFLVENGIEYVFGIGGHGNTPLLQALLPHSKSGKLRVFDVQHEAVAAHAATALKWLYGIECAVFTSIGPGWFNTLIAQSTAMSNGYGYLVFAGDKTTAYEGPNMQQIMRDGQFGFVKVADVLSKKGYSIVDPRNIYSVMREALAKTREPASAGPVNIFLPMNLQTVEHEYNLDMLLRPVPRPTYRMRPDSTQVKRAVAEILQHDRIAMRIGGGAVGAGEEVKALAQMIGAAVVMGPVAMDAVESDFPLNVGPAGSKGSISGNYAAENATLIIHVGCRGVCQSDCSGTLYKNAEQFININLNATEVLRYDGIPLVGDANASLQDLRTELQNCPKKHHDRDWLDSIATAKKRWSEYLQDYYNHPVLDGKLTQPGAIKAIDDYINTYAGIKILDAGDVQAQAFQIARHLRPKTLLNDTGNSCMGFAISAAFALGLVPDGGYPTAIIGDGSFLMQAQAIRDMVKHGSNCTIAVLDNQAMGAITALQWAQQYETFATTDPHATPSIDFKKMAESMGCVGFTPGPSVDSLTQALDRARKHHGPAVVDIKVTISREKYAALGAFGRWNVGPWSPEVEAIWEGKR